VSFAPCAKADVLKRQIAARAALNLANMVLLL
jgi:hypothetical protein